MDGAAQGVQANGERLSRLVGDEIGGGAQDLAHERTSLVFTREFFTHDTGQACLGPAGHEADGVDEVFFRRQQLVEAFFLREILRPPL